MHRDRAHTIVALLTIVALVVGCGSAASSPLPGGQTTPPTTVPSASRAAALPTPSVVIATPTTEPPTPVPTPTPTPTLPPPDPLTGKIAKGSVVVTVSDDLVVRSQPWVGADSTIYRPWLPLGTELTVMGDPAVGSGYTWYPVEPVSFEGLSGPGYGWVAAAGKDGEPWIAIATAAKEPPGVTLVQSEVARATANPKDAKSAAASVNAFGLDLLRAMLADGTITPADNAVFSPTSIALALAMARAGAKGETASQMDAVLHTTGWEALGPGLNALSQALASRDGPWQDYTGSAERSGLLALRIANTAFAQQGWKIEQPYLERIAATFGSGLRLLDYKADPEAARKTINAWVSDQTKKRIPELIPKVTPPLIDKLTRLVLVNAIYLKATWENEFAKSETKPARFTRLDDSRVAVPTMHADFQGDTPYATGTGWRATELRYMGPGRRPARHDPRPARRPGGLREEPLAEHAHADHGGHRQAARRCLTKGCIARASPHRRSTRHTPSISSCPASPSRPGPAWRRSSRRSACPSPSREEWPTSAASMSPRATRRSSTSPRSSTRRTSMSMRRAPWRRRPPPSSWGRRAAAAASRSARRSPSASTIPFLFFVRDLETGAVLFMGRVVDPSVGR